MTTPTADPAVPGATGNHPTPPTVAMPTPSSRPTLIKRGLPGGASRLGASLVVHISPICSLLAPCDPGAAHRQSALTQRGQASRDFTDAPLGCARCDREEPGRRRPVRERIRGQAPALTARPREFSPWPARR